MGLPIMKLGDCSQTGRTSSMQSSAAYSTRILSSPQSSTLMSIYPSSSQTLSSSSTNVHGTLSLPSSINAASSSPHILSLTPSPSPPQIPMECDNKGGNGDIKIIIPGMVAWVLVVAIFVLVGYLFFKCYRPRTPARWNFDSAAGSESPIWSEDSFFPDRPPHPQIHIE